jgi:multidrug efflux pump subunit AcrB
MRKKWKIGRRFSDASDHHSQVQDKLPALAGALPPSLKIEPLADQSVFVRAAISGVIREA